MGEVMSSRRWRAEMAASRQRLEAETSEKRRQETRADAAERRAVTRDDYDAIFSFLDRLERCITQSIATINEGRQAQLVTPRVVERTHTLVEQLTQLDANADYATAVERGATDEIRSSIRVIRHQMGELSLELSLAFGFADVEAGAALAGAAKDRALWFVVEIERLRDAVRRQQGVA